MARTPKTVEDRREQILDAAIRVFARKGFSRATNKDIAREANITAGLIYHYFDSKEALLQKIIEERSPLSLVRALPADMLQLPPAQFLHSLVTQVITFVEREQFVQIIHIVVPEMMHNPTIVPLAPQVLQQAIGFLAAFLERKMEQGELRRTDSSLAAQALVGSVIGFVLRRQILHDSLVLQYSQEELAAFIVETFLRGLDPN